MGEAEADLFSPSVPHFAELSHRGRRAVPTQTKEDNRRPALDQRPIVARPLLSPVHLHMSSSYVAHHTTTTPTFNPLINRALSSLAQLSSCELRCPRHAQLRPHGGCIQVASCGAGPDACTLLRAALTGLLASPLCHHLPSPSTLPAGQWRPASPPRFHLRLPALPPLRLLFFPFRAAAWPSAASFSAFSSSPSRLFTMLAQILCAPPFRFS